MSEDGVYVCLCMYTVLLAFQSYLILGTLRTSLSFRSIFLTFSPTSRRTTRLSPMGRQWFSWGGGGGRSSSSGKKRRESPRKPPPSNIGCMCAVLQIFDLPPHRSLSSFLQQDDPFEPTPKGAEAPRNSLELEEIMVLKPANVALKRETEETKILNNVSVGINQIRTSCEFSSSECSSSSPGGARTPNLVARLMGLDLLPENNNNGSSPASTFLSSSSRVDRARYLLLHRSGTLSLPETPRMSMTRKSDVEIYHRNRHQHHHHRLSLQINKENAVMGSGDDESTKRVDRIVKHLKESRKFGLDITNTTAAGEHCRKDRFLDTSTQVVLLKPSRPSAGKIAVNDDFAHAKNHSPRLLSSPKTEDPPAKQPQKTIPKQKCHHHAIPKGIPNSYKNTRRRKPPPQKEEAFVRPAANTAQENKKGAKRATPLSSPNNVPTILPAVMKKDRRPAPAPEKLVQKLEKGVLFVPKSGSLLSSSPSQTYKSPAATTARGGAPPLELEYIQRVLKRAGIEKETPVASSKWHSYSHPLNPSIFHYMELLHHSNLKRRSDRKLIFHLADELLAGILKSRRGSMNGSELAEALCLKIRELPSRECHVLEDIDALIDGDLKKSDKAERDGEVDGLVGEIERYVAEALVEETAAVVQEVARPYRWRRRREGGFMSQVLTF